MERTMMSSEVPLWKKVDILFRWGEEQGLNVTYKAVAEATGETWTNFNKIRRGANANPGLRTVEAMARYFGVKLDYFNCDSEAECWAYLKGLSENTVLMQAKKHTRSLSPAALVTLQNMIDQLVGYMEQVEGGSDESANEGGTQ